MKLVDYVVDNGEEEIYPTLREAIIAAKRYSKEKGEPVDVYRWLRPIRDDDMVLDEGFRLRVEPSGELSR